VCDPSRLSTRWRADIASVARGCTSRRKHIPFGSAVRSALSPRGTWRREEPHTDPAVASSRRLCQQFIALLGLQSVCEVELCGRVVSNRRARGGLILIASGSECFVVFLRAERRRRRSLECKRLKASGSGYALPRTSFRPQSGDWIDTQCLPAGDEGGQHRCDQEEHGGHQDSCEVRRGYREQQRAQVA
jgi:hypothetical protein